MSTSVAKERGKQHPENDCQQQQIPCVYFDIGCHVNVSIIFDENIKSKKLSSKSFFSTWYKIMSLQ